MNLQTALSVDQNSPLGAAFLSPMASFSGAVSSERAPHTERTCYGGPVMCEPGGSKTYTIPTAKNGIISKGFLQQMWGGMLF